MNKILLIIQREYLSRVRKKTFIILTVLAPIIMIGFIAVVVFLSTLESDKEKVILVNDHSGQFKESLKDDKTIKFTFSDDLDDEKAKKIITESNYYALLIIPDSVSGNNLEMISENQISITTKHYISNLIEKKLRYDKLQKMGVDPKIIDEVNPEVNIRTIKINKEGKEEISSAEIALAIGYVSSFMIYMFIFIYGAMVMRGVIEEKSNRVVEIIISSVKPFQLMMGKIVGVALVAFTQLAIWIVSGLLIMFAAQTVFGDSIGVQDQMMQAQEMQQNLNNSTFNDILASVSNLPIALILFSFVFYFIGGYLLYSSLFAAIGGAVDNETDTQQFMLPLTVPLILSLIIAQTVMQNPEGPAAFWFSIIPLTSPVVMMMRIAYGVPAWELILSMFLLIITFIGTTWLAAKIYRIGILIYGKKFTYKDLWLWLKFKG